MDASTLTLEISQVVTVLVTFGSLLKIHYSIKEKIALQSQEIKQLKTDSIQVKEEFEKLELEVDKNKDNVSQIYLETKQEIQNLTLQVEKNHSEVLIAISNIKR